MPLWRLIVQGKCPRCRQGDIFRTWMQIYDMCPSCELKFNRESGYFLGALYIEYGIAGVIIGVFAVVLHAGWKIDIPRSAGLGTVFFMPFIPLTIRLSRTLWIYWDQWVDPAESGR